MAPSVIPRSRGAALLASTLLCAATALALSACIFSGDGVTARYQKRSTDQIRYVDKNLRPKGLPPKNVVIPKDVRRFKVRVYADEQYRAQTIRWEDKFERRLSTFNAAMGPRFKVALELVDAQPWSASEAGESDLEAALTALEDLDPGTDVDWVIGLVTALPQVSATHNQIGMARLMGKHFVMRGYNDTAERSLFKKAFDEISEETLEQVHAERRLHKELLLFIHEWAHTLGAIHTTDERWIMAPVYTTKQAALSPGNSAIVDAALKHWGSDLSNDVAAMYADVATVVQSSGWSGWNAEARKQLLDILSRGPELAPVAKVSDRVVPVDRKAYYRAADLESQGKYAQAWRIAERLTERYENEPEIMILGCRVAARERGAKYPTEDLCAAATKLAPTSPEPPAALARIRLDEGKNDEALSLLLVVHERLDASGDDGVDRSQLWRDLAEHYYKLGVVSPLERALSHLPDEPRTKELQSFVATTRHRYGLPPNGKRFGITVAREKAYTDLVRQVLADTYGGNYPAAEKAAREGLKTYRNAPGLLVALCDTYARQRKYAQARKLCQRGLAGYEGAVWGHYLSAVLAQQQRNNRRAVAHFERTIELDPTLESAYRALATVYDQVGASDKGADLARRYRAQFSAPMPK